MAGISFGASADSTWIGAGWAFRQLLDDVRSCSALGSDAVQSLDRAEHIAFLAIESLDEATRAELIEGFSRVINGILRDDPRGTTAKGPSDDDTRRLYREEIASLQKAMRAA